MLECAQVHIRTNINSDITQFFAKALKQLNEDKVKYHLPVSILPVSLSNTIAPDTRREDHSLRTGVHRSSSFTTTP
jgi:hypothetical protein